MKLALVKWTRVEVDDPPPYETEKNTFILWCRRRCSSWGRGHSGGGWKPRTLRSPVLGTMIIVSLSLIVLLEVLSHISTRNNSEGGIAFAVDSSSFTIASLFGYSYLPTILAVCYSMLWTWIDLDVKRLEPWFQLSQDGGATASNSLLLQYPFDFLPFVPITAVRRKHWGVFFAGSVMLMIFWVLTPLQSAIFNTGSVSRNTKFNMTASLELLPLPLQDTGLNANFMNMAYGISWLDQRLPPYTTSDVALLPFQPTFSDSEIQATTTWSTISDVFYTNLTCSPAEVLLQEQLSYTFSNGKGCTVPDIVLSDTQIFGYMINYIGYFDNPQSDWALQNPTCSLEFSNNFLALWASASSRVANGVYSNFTAMFCEPSYTSQEMYVTVNATTGEVQKVEPLTTAGSSVTKLGDIFNITNFEYLLATGVPSTGGSSNLDEISILQQNSRIKDYNITLPVSNMVGFAVGLSPTSVSTLSDPANLRNAFQVAHRVLFSAAFSTLTTWKVDHDMQYIRSGVQTDYPAAIILVRPISIAVEAALGLIIVLTSCLWCFSHRRRSCLTRDPATIADLMSLISPSSGLSAVIHDDGTLTSAKLALALSPREYHLGKGHDGSPCILTALDEGNTGLSTLKQSHVSGEDNESFVALQPVELRLVFGGSFITIIGVAVAAVSFLKNPTNAPLGISLPTNDAVVRSIIENYAPTTFATFIEPVWTMLNHLLCLLQPFEELRKGRARASRSLEVKYTSIPPQLAFWRALRAGHYILAAVCVVAVSSNVLAVALSGLLVESPATAVVPVASSYTLLPHFNGFTLVNPTDLSGPYVYFDHFYVALANITESAPLPPWVDQKFFYLPFDLKSVNSAGSVNAVFQHFRGNTTGFGTTVTCTEPPSLLFEVARNGSTIQFSTSHVLPNGTQVTCIHPRGFGNAVNETTDEMNTFMDGPLAFEAVLNTMQSLSGTGDDGFCEASMVVGWARVAAETTNDRRTNTTSLPARKVAPMFLSCTQKLVVAQFDIQVDSTGRIISSNQITDFDININSYFNPNATLESVETGPFNSSFFGPINSENRLFQETSFFIAMDNFDFLWHNDTFTSDWMNVLLTKIQNSTDLVNPNVPLPDATVLGPMVEALYQKLFAILLGLNPRIFSTAPDGISVTVQAIFIEPRIFLSETMFLLTVVLLSFHLFVAIIYYIYRPTRFLPRMPTSIASIIAFVSNSRAMVDYNGNGRIHGNPDQRYGYGRFVGTDGKTHVGIEQQRFVVLLQSRNPDIIRRKRDLLKTKAENHPRNWI
ncbi:uncharacterized protein LY89DRAFT_661803 [Mollisia scopiformis]|uniref:Uncharacterized protein n=1 Tax=Mollisia scopiformis TaxID=149040 RepID=A0A132B3B8_MOLSC|nr:uncharacterized protein LY89DRAFT_661803 [Mollisia scopiformis]KUJ06743.1 hypothetical protein LY89DRAFT_661803 [Mollisia scopiformis]